VGTRVASDLGASLVAEMDGDLVASNFLTHWGSFAFFGPLTVHPDSWDKGIAQLLLEPTMEQFRRWRVRHAGLFTFAHSDKHVNLYQRYGFWPRFLTAVMAKPAQVRSVAWTAFSRYKENDRAQAVSACHELTTTIFEGLDVTREISAIQQLKLGDTVLLWSDDVLDGFACCHCGPGTEAGADTCYVKFGAVRPSNRAEERFDHLLEAGESLAAERGLSRVEAGVNLARERAYRKMRAKGYRTETQGVAMHKPNECRFSDSAIFVVDDWR